MTNFPKKIAFKEAIKECLIKLKIKTNLLNEENDHEIDNLAQKMEDRVFSFRDFNNSINRSQHIYEYDLLVDENLDYKAEHLLRAINEIEMSDGEHFLSKKTI